MANPIEIKFYHKGEDCYYEFTNFYQGKPINFPLISGYEYLQGQWKTAEHLFQAAGFRDRKNIVEQFRNLDDPREAFNLKRKLFEQGTSLTDGRKGWDGTGSGSWENDGSNAKKIAVMRMVVELKFRQDDYLKDLLLKTRGKKIIEDTKSDTLNPEKKRDDCWGNATLYERDDKGRKTKSTGKEGKNWLGVILVDVRTKLQNEGPPLDPLKDLKDNTINQINQKMAADPEIKASELQDKNQSWKDDIQKATQKNQITRVYDELKADIETKRDKKKLVKAFQKLISQAQQARQTDNSSTLAQLLTQIYNYQGNSRLYSQYESEIKQWETYVNQQDTNSFKSLKIGAINDLLQQEPKVTITELKGESRDFQRIISQTSDFTKLTQFERQVRDNVFEVRTKKKFDQLLTNAQSAKSEEEKSLVTQQVYKWRDSTDEWESKIWQQRKSEAEAFLNKWSRGEDNDNNDENTKDDSHWLKQAFQIAAVGISLALVIWLLAKLVKKERKFK